jgi:hypothetical protein
MDEPTEEELEIQTELASRNLPQTNRHEADPATSAKAAKLALKLKLEQELQKLRAWPDLNGPPEGMPFEDDETAHAGKDRPTRFF